MPTLRFLHRWTGAILGLLLAVLGLSGTALVFKTDWLHATLPGASAPLNPDTQAMGAAITRLMTEHAPRLTSLTLPSERLGVYRLSYERHAGGYADQSGTLITQWVDHQRLEAWLFTLHRHLLAGETGEIIVGLAGIAGLIFSFTGLILWWPLRRRFRLKLWPARLSRPAFILHHRDLGALFSPALLLLCLTGALMALPSVANFLLAPLGALEEARESIKPPLTPPEQTLDRLDWTALLHTARTRFPEASVRTIILPKKPGESITVRLRQPFEWQPNGQTRMFFSPHSGTLIGVRDAAQHPTVLKVFSLAYPLHTGPAPLDMVGRRLYQLVLALTGTALTLLGLLATFSFWRWNKVSSQRPTLRPERKDLISA